MKNFISFLKYIRNIINFQINLSLMKLIFIS
jgi:hypothetical protein